MRILDVDDPLTVPAAAAVAFVQYSHEDGTEVDQRGPAGLTALEAGYAGRLRSVERRAAWVAGRLAAKAAIARLTSLPPDAVEVLPASTGEPVVRLAPGSPPVDVSIAHRAGLAAAIAFRRAATGAIGIDVEAVDQVLDPALVSFAFGTEEATLVAGSADPAERHRCTLSLWTAKEAVLKATRRGLRAPLSDVRLEPLGVHGRFSATVEHQGASGATFDVETSHVRNHLVAVAVERPAGRG